LMISGLVNASHIWATGALILMRTIAVVLFFILCLLLVSTQNDAKTGLRRVVARLAAASH
jgi:hypothetical protein